MTSLVAAATFLLATHFGIASTPLRGAIVGRIGEPPYLGLYSALSFAAFGWLGFAWYHAPFVPLYPALPALKWAPTVLVPIAMWMIVASVTTPNPTAVQGERLLDRADAATGMLRITRHPMLVGFTLWAAAHLVANPDLADWIAFSGLGLLGLAGPALIDRRRARTRPDTWARYAAVTSSVPFLAILQGRQRFPTEPRFWLQGVVGIGLALLVGGLHPVLLGVVAFP